MPASEQDLIDALSRIAMGDKAAFRLVYVATSAKLYGIVGRILRRRDLAEEVLQEVYVRVWQRAGDFDPTISSPITWLVTLARNRALDEVRRRPMESLDDQPDLLELPNADDALAGYERMEERRRLQACLDQLEPEKRNVVRLAYYYGMTRKEIADRTDRPVSTVKTWLRRSLAQIKDCLGT
jgi:RNA polymerase sigma-70 factor (ECF subfamily)